MEHRIERRRRCRWWIGFLAAATVLCFFGSLLVGEKTEEFGKKEVFGRIGETCRIVLRHIPLLGKLLDQSPSDETMDRIIWHIRAPRLVLAVLVGASLSAAGAVMQCFFQNPMACPYIVGVSSGAALGATIAFAFDISLRFGQDATSTLSLLMADNWAAWWLFVGGLSIVLLAYLLSARGRDIQLPALLAAGAALGTAALSAWFLVSWREPYERASIALPCVGAVFSFLSDQPEAWLAFFGGLGVTFVVYLLSRRGGKIHLPTLLLSGIALGTLALSLAWFILFWRKPYDYEGIIFRLMGSFNGKGWGKVGMVFPYVLLGVCVSVVFSRDLNVLLLGEETAQHLGVHVERVKLLLLVLSTVMAAACVAAVGVIGFVGLMIPHLMRLLVGPDHRVLIPACLFGGGLLLILADTAARVFLDEMVPIGVITALLGCPFFLYLLTRKEKRFF